MKTSPLISKIVTIVLSGLAVLGLSAAAFAWPPDAMAATPAPGEDYSNLEMAYGNAQVALKGQQNRIDLAKQIAANVQTFVDAQKANGKDTSSLDAALANYSAQFASAQTAHDQAASVLSTHAGFGAASGIPIGSRKSRLTRATSSAGSICVGCFRACINAARRPCWTGSRTTRHAVGSL